MASYNDNELTRSPEGKTTECCGKESYLSKWIETYNLDTTTVFCLEAEELDNMESLKKFPINEISTLQLNSKQEISLRAALHSLHIANEDPVNELEKWAAQFGISAETVEKLQTVGIDDLEKLKHMTQDVIIGLQIKAGQRIKLKELAKTHVPERKTNTDATLKKSSKKGVTDIGSPSSGVFSEVSRFVKRKVQGVKTGAYNLMRYLKTAGAKRNPIRKVTETGMVNWKIPVEEIYKDTNGLVRKCIIGRHNIKKHQKTIMMVGATGAGKSRLIDGICNYIFDVKWEETTRFKMIDEHEDEARNAEFGQTMSQTEWITIYTICNGDSTRLPFTLNLIDTPGFGDTRGITRDEKLVEQIRSLFINNDKHEIDSIDAVCFVAKAPDARLTAAQRYIFNSIMAVFGKDIAGNIVVMVTFADGDTPPVLQAIKEAKLPYIESFLFNNSALLANNGNTMHNSSSGINKFSKLFWEMSIENYEAFFAFLGRLSQKSLFLTAYVLEQRKDLKDTLSCLEEKVRDGLTTMNDLKQEEKYLRENEDRVEDNQNFTYIEKRPSFEKVKCEPGRNVTHCMVCHVTCHIKCTKRTDKEKEKCCRMNRETGKCRVCKLECHWSDHQSTDYYLKPITLSIIQTWETKKKEFMEATGTVATTKNIIKGIETQYAKSEAEVREYVKRCRDILELLRQIALKPDPFTENDYIDELIQTEKDEHKSGWQQRVEQLKSLKTEADMIRKVTKNQLLLTTV